MLWEEFVEAVENEELRMEALSLSYRVHTSSSTWHSVKVAVLVRSEVGTVFWVEGVGRGFGNNREGTVLDMLPTDVDSSIATLEEYCQWKQIPCTTDTIWVYHKENLHP